MAETRWIGGSPFAEKKPVKKIALLSDVEITDEPYAPTVRAYHKKYLPTIKTMKPGQAIKCDPEMVKEIARAMNYHLKTLSNGEKLMVRSRKYHDDGRGRVWLLKAE